MPSIRRALTLYLLLLVGGGLAVVAAVTDELVGRTLAARRAAEADRIRAKFDEQCRADRERLDADLWAEAQAVLDQMRVRFDRHNAQFFRAELPVVQAAAGGPAVQLAVPLHFAQLRVGDEVLPATDPAHPDAHPPLCEVAVTGRAEPLMRSAALGGADFPPVGVSPERALDAEFGYDTPTVGGREVRRLVFKAPVLGSRLPRRPPNRGDRRPGPAADRPPRGDRPPDRGGPGPLPRLGVQYARPLASLDDDTARHRHDLDRQTADLDAGIGRDRAALRLQVAGVAGVTFLGLLVGGPLVVRRGLRPVQRLSDAVGRVSERDFRLPVEPRDVGRELLPIHDRLTHTLLALRRAFDREKQAVADISHELRTPVAGLQATLDVALRRPRTADQYRATLEESRVIVRQLGRLVERVLTLARLDAEGLASKRVPVDLGELVAECVAVVRPLAEAHGLAVTADLPPGLVAVTDGDQVREVVMNLLSNAVEYNRPGGTVGVCVGPAAGGPVVTVRDTGIGMPPEVADRIFERFFRADPSRQATGAHAGLGLAIVKEAVAKLGGTVTVESVPGQGSTFRVRLPADGPGERPV